MKNLLSEINFNKINRSNFPGSMDPSEIFSFISLIKKNKINLVIESGRQYGYSTYFIGKFCQKNNIRFISIDDGTNKKADLFSRNILKNILVKYNYGNFFFVIKKILLLSQKKNIAMLIDGPKGIQVYAFCYELLKKNKNINFIFFDNYFFQSKIRQQICHKIFSKVYSYENLNFSNEIKMSLNKFNTKHKKKNSKINDFAYINLNSYRNSWYSVFLRNSINFYYKQRRSFARIFKKIK